MTVGAPWDRHFRLKYNKTLKLETRGSQSFLAIEGHAHAFFGHAGESFGGEQMLGAVVIGALIQIFHRDPEMITEFEHEEFQASILIAIFDLLDEKTPSLFIK